MLTVGATSYADATARSTAPRGSSSRLFAGLLFAVVIAGVLLGLMIIVATGFGMEVSFDTIYPTLVDK